MGVGWGGWEFAHTICSVCKVNLMNEFLRCVRLSAEPDTAAAALVGLVLTSLSMIPAEKKKIKDLSI